MKLIVKLLSGEESLEVSDDATVSGLKQRISQLHKQPPCLQRLWVDNGHRINLGDDYRSLSSYGLQSGSTVILLIAKRFQVIVKNEACVPKTYDVEADETVDQLKTKIFQKERVPEDQQRLIFDTRELESGKKLQDYLTQAKSPIQMVLRLRGG